MNLETKTLNENELPKYDMSDNPTGCCPRFNPQAWDDRETHFRDKLFVKAKTKSLLHVPLNMGKVFKRTFGSIESAGAMDLNQFVVLSRDISPWSAEHYFAVTKEVPGQTMVRLSGDYLTKVFEGTFSNIPKWCEELKELGNRRGNMTGETFYFYTTCPKCAKTYGKNYVVGFVGIDQSKQHTTET